MGSFLLLRFPFLGNSRFMPSLIKDKIFSVVQSTGIFTLAGTVLCRSNRKERNLPTACEAYWQSKVGKKIERITFFLPNLFGFRKVCA